MEQFLWHCQSVFAQNSYQVDGLHMQVPMTVAYDSAHVKPPCSAPAVVYAYGAYGKCLDMAWAPEYQILLEQGFVIAFAHVRGGGELGRRFAHC